MGGHVQAELMVSALKAAAEPTRLRIILLLAASELSVKDLTRILGQSQPRISRHLKLLHEAGLIERSREGSWVYFTLGNATAASALARSLASQVDRNEGAVARDLERAGALKIEREEAAQAYFAAHAAKWDQIRSLHVPERLVEDAILKAVGTRSYGTLVDLGTGTGRMLELLAGHYHYGIGIDFNHSMLAYARSKLSAVSPGRATFRHGDMYSLMMEDRSADAVVMHQVLHFLSDPRRAIAEAARILKPGGDLLIVDFAPHEIEYLRERFAHDRLGFSRAVIEGWTKDAGLELTVAQDLMPTDASAQNQLTVSLWLARRPGSQAATNPPSASFERLQPVEHLP